MKFRTPLKIAKGNGSAKSGTGHWINQRVTAIALVPLTFLFMCLLMILLGAQNYQDVAEKLSNPFWSTILIAFIIVGFYHGALGIQVIIEDYISSEMPKMLLLVAVRLFAGFLALLAVVSILKIAIT